MANLSELFFPSLNDDCTIDTEPFLHASQDLINLINKFGKVFTQIKYDMQTNLDILTKRYNSNKILNGKIQNMLEASAGQKNHGVEEAFLWLKRELEFFYTFFSKIVMLHKSKDGIPEDLLIPLRIAYGETLENYHSWMAQQLFTLLARMVPTKTQFFNIISNKSTDNADVIIEELSRFLATFKPVLMHLIHHIEY